MDMPTEEERKIYKKKQEEYEKKLNIVAGVTSGITLGTVGYTAWNNEKYAKYLMALIILVIILVVITILYASWSDATYKGADATSYAQAQGWVIGMIWIGIFLILAPVLFVTSAYSWYFTLTNIIKS